MSGDLRKKAVKDFRKYAKYLTKEGFEWGQKRLRERLSAYSAAPGEERHIVGRVIPTMALCEALEFEGLSKEEAIARASGLFHKEFVVGAVKWFHRFLRLPGMIRVFPKMCVKMMKKTYGPESGFEMTFNEVSDARIAFDVTVCPYWEYCRKEGYPTLTRAFCDSDDLTFSGLEPAVCFRREGTLGREDPLCDFDFRMYD